MKKIIYLLLSTVRMCFFSTFWYKTVFQIIIGLKFLVLKHSLNSAFQNMNVLQNIFLFILVFLNWEDSTKTNIHLGSEREPLHVVRAFVLRAT